MACEIKIPSFCTSSYILDFLKAVETIFEWKGKRTPEVLFNLKDVEKIDMLGVLLNYKIIEFCVENECISRSKIVTSRYVENKLSELQFLDLLNDYLTQKKANYSNLNFKAGDRFFIAPFPLLRKNKYTLDKIKEDYLPQIEQYYKEHIYDKEKNIASMILQCFSEILLNFWEHAVNDTKSIIIANGNADYIEMACADTGEGIISTLRPIINQEKDMDIDILRESLKQGVTSKKDTNHMGCGLWIINQIVEQTKGKLILVSEGRFLKKEFGTYSSGECAYWGGTIIYVFLSLTSPKNIIDILPKDDIKVLNDLNITFR